MVFRYEGGLKNGVREGYGCYVDKVVNFRYEGEWHDGKKHGKGVCTFADGSSYDGEWRRGREHGQGTLTYPDGGKYVGEFQVRATCICPESWDVIMRGGLRGFRLADDEDGEGSGREGGAWGVGW